MSGRYRLAFSVRPQIDVWILWLPRPAMLKARRRYARVRFQRRRARRIERQLHVCQTEVTPGELPDLQGMGVVKVPPASSVQIAARPDPAFLPPPLQYVPPGPLSYAREPRVEVPRHQEDCRVWVVLGDVVEAAVVQAGVETARRRPPDPDVGIKFDDPFRSVVNVAPFERRRAGQKIVPHAISDSELGSRVRDKGVRAGHFPAPEEFGEGQCAALGQVEADDRGGEREVSGGIVPRQGDVHASFQFVEIIHEVFA